jgi:DNA-binding transcriptional LysR family regulator
VDELGSLREAAAALHMTQPAATKLVQDLEDALGVPLFDRHRRGMRATHFGELMVRHARMVITDLDHAREQLSAMRAGAAGHVRVGAVMGAIPFVIARTIAEVKRERPALLLTVVVETSDRLVPGLDRGELDVVLARPVDVASGHDFGYERLLDEPLAVVARQDHPLVETDEEVALASLAAWPWVLLPRGSPMRGVLAPLFREMGVDRPPNVVESSSILMTTALLEQTEMLAVLPEDVARYYADRGILAVVPVRLPPVMGSFGILTRSDRPLPPGAAVFVETLRAAAQQ